MTFETIRARALLVGARIDTRQIRGFEQLALAPLTLRIGTQGFVAVFRFGALVAFRTTRDEEQAFLEAIASQIEGRFDRIEDEMFELRVAPDASEGVDASGILFLKEAPVEALQVVAHVLAKSVVLARHEARTARVFENIAELAKSLSQGKIPARRDTLLRQIGDSLQILAQTVGQAEVAEKPELTWTNSALDRLYEHLALEFELRERDAALSRKLQIIADSAETYLNLIYSRQSIRVEWYIVFLIVIEIVLVAIYEISTR